MTDRPADRPLDDDLPEVDRAFELASALHDGEGDDVERARADDAVRAEARSVAAVARRVAEVPPAPAGLVDDHVAAAMAAFDGAVDEVDADTPAAPVRSLAGRRSWWQQAPLGAVAAAVAVVALVGAIGFAAVNGGDDDTDTTATAALESADDAGDAAGGEAETFDAAGDTAITGDERERFATYDELAVALAERPTDRATDGSGGDEDAAAEAPVTEESLPPDAAAGTTGGAAGCDAIGVAGIDPASVALVVPVVVGDQLITAVVHGADGGRRLTAIDEASCTVVDERSL